MRYGFSPLSLLENMSTLHGRLSKLKQILKENFKNERLDL